MTNTTFLDFLLTFAVISLLTQDYPFPVNANLLIHSDRAINKPAKSDIVLKFMTESPISPLLRPDAITLEPLPEFDFYSQFLASFSDFRKWASATLIFPETILPKQCEQLRKVLLRSAGIQTTCLGWENEFTYNNTTHVNTKTFAKSWKLMTTSDPVVLLQFLSLNPASSYPNFLTRFEASHEILILAGNVSSDLVIRGVQPKANSNYKWTLAQLALDNKTNSRKFEVRHVFGFATSNDPILQYVGFWSQAQGIQIDERNGLSDFGGKLIRITSVEGNPVVYLDRNATTGEVKGRGYLPDILDSLSAFLNFKYILLEPKDRGFGSVDGSGNWSGMVGMLQRKEAEMALMSFSLTAQRKQVMDFSPPVEYSATRLLIRKDFEVTDLKWESFASPFHWSVWVAIPVTILLGVITLVIFTRFDLLESTPLSSTCLLFCCFLQQGQEGHSYFRKFPSRIVLGSFWVLAVVIYASYTARLTSFLAATTETLPFKSLLDAVQNKNWKLGLVQGSSFWDRVKESPEPEMKIFTKRVNTDPSTFVGGFRPGIERVYNEKYIFFTSDLVPSFMVKGNCSFTWIPGKYFPGFGYMGYQEKLPYASAISHRVSKLRESGQMRRLFRKWWGDEASCSKGNEAFMGMSLYETGTAFLIIIVGLSLAVLCLTGEMFFRPRNEAPESAVVTMLPGTLEANSFSTADLRNQNTQSQLSNFEQSELWRTDKTQRPYTFKKPTTANLKSLKNEEYPDELQPSYFNGK